MLPKQKTIAAAVTVLITDPGREPLKATEMFQALHTDISLCCSEPPTMYTGTRKMMRMQEWNAKPSGEVHTVSVDVSFTGSSLQT